MDHRDLLVDRIADWRSPAPQELSGSKQRLVMGDSVAESDQYADAFLQRESAVTRSPTRYPEECAIQHRLPERLLVTSTDEGSPEPEAQLGYHAIGL